jgi:hypothetical protein
MKNGEKILLSYLIYFSSITEIRRRKTSEALKAEMTKQFQITVQHLIRKIRRSTHFHNGSKLLRVNIVSEHRNTELEKNPHINIVFKDDYYENVFQMTDHLHASGAKGPEV